MFSKVCVLAQALERNAMLKGRKRATFLRQMPSRVKGKMLDEEAPAEEAPAEDAGAEVAGNATVLCCCHCLYVSHLACVYLSLCLSVCLPVCLPVSL